MKRHFCRPACFGVVLVMALGCDSQSPGPVDPPGPSTGTIQGTVTMGPAPVSGARISLTGAAEDRTVFSGTEGGFSFTKLQPGMYAVSASISEVECSSTTSEVKAGETATASIDCPISPPQGTMSSIMGAVTVAGEPLGSARVTLIGSSFGRVQTTGEDGRFGFGGLASGTYTVAAAASGYSCATLVTDVEARRTATVELACVEDADGAKSPVSPIAGPGKIAFERGGRIMVLDLESNNLSHLVDGLAPSWSPDGSRLAFQRPRCLDRSVPPGIWCDDIWVVRADGSGLTAITSYEWVWDFDPVWSPDGSRIAYIRFIHGIDDTYLVVSEVEPPSALWSEVVLSAWWPLWRPTWSPDGGRIAFACAGPAPFWESDLCFAPSDVDHGYSESYNIPVLFPPIQKIIRDTWTHTDPAWSPDGVRIAFATNRDAVDGHSYIALVAPNGTGFTRLGPGRRPAWSPDGTRIVFVGEAGAPGLYVMNADGSGLARITDDPADDSPSWGR